MLVYVHHDLCELRNICDLVSSYCDYYSTIDHRWSVISYEREEKRKDKNRSSCTRITETYKLYVFRKRSAFNKPTLKIFELLPWFFYLVKDEARSRTTTWHNNPFSLKVFRNKTCAFTDPCHREVSNSDCSHHRFTITESKFPYFRNFATFSKDIS